MARRADRGRAVRHGGGSLGRPILWIVDENDETVLLIEEERRCPCGLTDDEHEAAGLEPGVFS